IPDGARAGRGIRQEEPRDPHLLRARKDQQVSEPGVARGVGRIGGYVELFGLRGCVDGSVLGEDALTIGARARPWNRPAAGPTQARLILINCSAFFRASGVSFWPESMRPISRVRASRSSSSTSAMVRPFNSRFSTK